MAAAQADLERTSEGLQSGELLVAFEWIYEAELTKGLQLPAGLEQPQTISPKVSLTCVTSLDFMQIGAYVHTHFAQQNSSCSEAETACCTCLMQIVAVHEVDDCSHLSRMCQVLKTTEWFRLAHLWWQAASLVWLHFEGRSGWLKDPAQVYGINQLSSNVSV